MRTELPEQIYAVLTIMAALAGALWWLRRRPGFAAGLAAGRRHRTLQVVERLVLTPHHSLHLVRNGDRALLIGTSPGGYSLLESREGQPRGEGE